MCLNHAVRPIIHPLFFPVCNPCCVYGNENAAAAEISGVLIDKLWFKSSIFRAIVKMICSRKSVVNEQINVNGLSCDQYTRGDRLHDSTKIDENALHKWKNVSLGQTLNSNFMSVVHSNCLKCSNILLSQTPDVSTPSMKTTHIH